MSGVSFGFFDASFRVMRVFERGSTSKKLFPSSLVLFVLRFFALFSDSQAKIPCRSVNVPDTDEDKIDEYLFIVCLQQHSHVHHPILLLLNSCFECSRSS